MIVAPSQKELEAEIIRSLQSFQKRGTSKWSPLIILGTQSANPERDWYRHLKQRLNEGGIPDGKSTERT